VLDDVRDAVEDWPKMREAAQRLAAELDEPPVGVDRRQVQEAKGLRGWGEGTSPSWATASRSSPLTSLARGTPSPARCCARCPARGWASSATTSGCRRGGSAGCRCGARGGPAGGGAG